MTRPLSWTIEGNDRLSDVLERIDATLNKVGKKLDHVGDQAQGMGRKLDEAEDKTRKFGDTANRSESKLDGFTTKLGDMSKKVGGYAAAVGAAALAAVAAVGAAGAAFALEKSKVDALLAGQVGVSGQEAKELGKVAGQLYAQGWAESVGEAAEAVRSTLQNRLTDLDAAGEPIDQLSTRTSALAAMMQEEFDRVTAAVSTMLRTRIARNAEEAFDLLTVATQRGVNKSQDLLDTMTEYSVQFAALGIDAPKALGLMVQALDAGARNSDVAADAIKEFAIRSKDGSATSAKAFSDLGLDAKKMFDIFARGGPDADRAMKTVLDRLRAVKDPSDKAALSVALFGTKAEDLQDSLYAFDPTTAVAALGDVKDASDEFIDSQSSAGQKVETMWRRIELAVADKVLPIIEKVLDKLEELGNDPEVQQWLDDLEAAVAAVMPMLEGAFDFMLKAFKDNEDTIFIGLMGLIATVAAFGAAIMGLIAVFTYVAGVIHTVWKTMLDYVLDQIELFVVLAAKAFGWVPGLGPKLEQAAADFHNFRDKVNNALDGIHDKTVTIAVKAVGAGAVGGAQLGGGLQSGSQPAPRRAAGGPVWPGQVYQWQEQGSEWLMLSGGSGRVVSNQDVRAAQSGGGGDVVGTLVVVHKTPDGQTLRTELLELKRQRGLASLGF